MVAYLRYCLSGGGLLVELRIAKRGDFVRFAYYFFGEKSG